MRLGFLIQNVGEMDFPFPVKSFDGHVDFRMIRHLFSSSS